jgi:flagellar biosynthetic protein FlhB
MAEQNQDGQERTEDPTPKRLREAREKGNIPRSRELSTMMVTLTGAAALLLFGRGLSDMILERLRNSFSPRAEDLADPRYLLRALNDAIVDGLMALMPFFVLCLAAALLGPLMLGGWNFTTQALQPKLEKLDPIKGFARLFAPRNLVELGKAIAKFLLVGAVALMLLRSLMDQIIALGMEPVRQALGHAVQLCLLSLLVMCASLAVIAAIDVPFQLWDYTRKMRMTLREVRDEMKETDGRPEVKSKIRQTQQQLARRRMMEEVPHADVVVTNPVHVAVALRYEDGEMTAPRVVAKGTDLVALRIREIATENRVPVFEAPPLARALNAHADIGEEIPRPLYHAVAQVLSYVYALRRARRYEIPTPAVPEIEVPAELTPPPTGMETDR